MLSCKGLTHKFDYTLFEGVDLHAAPRTTNAITGVSGSGKSTLLHILSSFLAPNSGEVFYQNRSLYKLDTNELINIRRLDFGVIFQQHYLFRGFSAKENITLACIVAQKEFDLQLCKRLKIEHILDQKVGSLSGGQQQRVSIARVLSKKPRVIFADEPTGNLDAATAGEVMEVVFEYVAQNDAALVMVTHDEALARRCDTHFCLQEGRLVKSNSVLTPR